MMWRSVVDLLLPGDVTLRTARIQDDPSASRGMTSACAEVKMSKPASRRRIIACAAALGIVAAFLAVRGLSVRDVLSLATEKAAQAASDTRALLNGETTERVARELRNEAAQISGAAEAARGGSRPSSSASSRQSANAFSKRARRAAEKRGQAPRRRSRRAQAAGPGECATGGRDRVSRAAGALRQRTEG
jgi:hypothetical protein